MSHPARREVGSAERAIRFLGFALSCESAIVSTETLCPSSTPA